MVQTNKFQKILVANRGEIAVRAIRACRELDISVAVLYSRSDAHSLAVKLADEAYFISGENDIDAYLDQAKIVDIAIVHKCDAIYPGYGFLAENPDFAALCEERGVVFIGPSSQVLSKVGDKIEAKKIAQKLDVPEVPGEHAECSSIEHGQKLAKQIGYPIVIKAAGGGGGRGIRVVHKRKDFAAQFKKAQREARFAFDNPCVYIEKYIERPRHVEFQVLADAFGKVIHLGERDCSIQRRHQKLIEEAPSSLLDQDSRKEIGEWAVKLIREVGLIGVATVEFLIDANNNYYFIEVNPRIQVEHGVTELVTGVDLVKWQIKIAQGNKLDLGQKDIQIKGHAIECRINAEDPSADFSASPGIIEQYLPPGGNGVRICGGIFVGQEISAQYDTLIVKLMTWGKDRKEAIGRMQRALREFIIQGIATTVPFHQAVLHSKAFEKGEIDTNFIADNKIGRQVKKIIEQQKKPDLYNDNLEASKYKEIAVIAASIYKNLSKEMGNKKNGHTNPWLQQSRNEQIR